MVKLTKKIILAIDDEESIRIALNELLTVSGYSVKLAENADVALEILKKKKPDLMILDVMMPGMKSVDFIKKVKSNKKYKSIPIIHLTVVAVSMAEKISMKKKGLVVDYITKPFDIDDLLDSIKRVI